MNQKVSVLNVFALVVSMSAVSSAQPLEITEPIQPGAVEACASPPPYFNVPSFLSDCSDPDCGRLHPLLREQVRTGDARSILVRSAVVHYVVQRGWPVQIVPWFPPNAAYAQALADLAVTGQRTYRSFQQLAPRQAGLIAPVTAELIAFFPSHQPVASDVRAAVDLALQRAYQVAWALRGPTPHRQTQRNGLGWIAVDGDDDPPHRPVNVPSANHFQGNMTVQVGAIPVVTRYVVASRSITDNNPVQINSIPPDRSLPLIVGDIILFIPGHSSSAEEPEALIGPLLDEAAGRGRPLTLISMDLPSNGYASMIEHTTIAGGALPAWNTGYQLLDFLENFIVAFVDGLEAQQPGIKRQIIGVIGGSLGGNLTLRLGRRDPVTYPWLHSLVSWSPASSWLSWERAVAAYPEPRGRYYDLKRNAARGAFGPRKFMLDEEVEEPYDKSSLNHLFYGRAPTGDAIGRVEQAEFWYSTYYGCADTAKAGSHRMLYEIYNPRFRRWHWRIAYEQLIYSHHDSDNPSTSIDPDPRIDPAAGPARYSQIKSRLLLAAGVEDNMDPVRIYSETRRLAALMTMVNGTTLYVRETGHSIDTERPKFFSKRILDFLFVNPSPPFPYFLTAAANF